MTYPTDHKRVSLIDIKTTTMTLDEVLARIEQYKAEPNWAGYSFFIDGDTYSICAELMA